MSTVKINNKTYEVPELTFTHSKQFEKYGVPLMRMFDLNLLFTIVSAFIAVVVGCDIDTADYLAEQHILGGGNIEDIYEAYTKAMSESLFFKTLLENQEKKTKAKKTENENPTE